MKNTANLKLIVRAAGSIVFGGALAMLCISAALAQSGAPVSNSPAPGAAADQAKAGAQAGAKKADANEKLVTPVQKVDGTYAVDLVLPAWTVHNLLTLCSSSDGKTVTGSLHDAAAPNKLMGDIGNGYLNNSGFLAHVQVGPGGLDFVGSADGKTITGRVAIDMKYSEFKGTLSDKKFDCPAGK